MLKHFSLISFLLLAFFNKSKGTIVTTTGTPFFTENKGQVCDQFQNLRNDVLYSGFDGKILFHIRNNGISYQLNKVTGWTDSPITASKKYSMMPVAMVANTLIQRVDATWLNSNNDISFRGDNAQDGYTNYYLQHCPNGALYAKTFSSVILSNIYDGVDVRYYTQNGVLEYDYHVAAHSSYKQIRTTISGAVIKKQKDGSLLLVTPLGEIIEGAPVAFQNGKQLKARWVIEGQVLSFEIENHDPDLALRIDPPTRAWGTYYGWIGNDQGMDCETDNANNVYLSGYSSGTNTVIATSGAHQSNLAGNDDAFLVKFNPSGIRQWATYYGGPDYETGASCCVDGSGNIFMTGITGSSGAAITTTGAHQANYGGGAADSYLVKFNSAGVRQWGTLYGGDDNDYSYSCKNDPAGNVFIYGWSSSSSTTLIATTGAFQSQFAGGYNDVFLAKFSTNGVRLWGTYFGGNGNDEPGYCATDQSGNVFISGFTGSTSGIVTSGAHQQVYGGGVSDGFLAKFDGSGNRLWATYYGGSNDDSGQSCSASSTGEIYFTGITSSTGNNVISTPLSHQVTTTGQTNAFLVKFSASGARLWGTYYGGSGTSYGMDCMVGPTNDVFLFGSAGNSGTLIATAGSPQPIFGGGSSDGFIGKFNSSGQRIWGSYYGGSGFDFCRAGTVDNAGSCFITGYTETTTGTGIAAGGHQNVFGGFKDAYLVKIADSCQVLGTPIGPIMGTASLCAGASATYSINSVGAATSYSWSAPSSWLTTFLFNQAFITPNISGIVSVKVMNTCDTSAIMSLSVTVIPLPNINVNADKTVICGAPASESVILNATGGTSYTWSTGNSGSTEIISPLISNTFSVSGANVQGCTNSATISILVEACTAIRQNQTNDELFMYPNPCNRFFQINTLSSADLAVYSVTGNLIYSAKIGAGTTTVDTRDFNSGIYFISIGNNGTRVNKKLVVAN